LYLKHFATKAIILAASTELPNLDIGMRQLQKLYLKKATLFIGQIRLHFRAPYFRAAYTPTSALDVYKKFGFEA